MPQAVLKICRVCGRDVSQSKRTKDGQGRYYCNPCYAARTSDAGEPAIGKAEVVIAVAPGMGPASAVSTPPDSNPPDRSGLLTFAVSGLVGIGVLAAVLYFFVFRDRWENENGLQLASMVEDARTFARRKDWSAAQAKYDETFRLLGDHSVRGSELRGNLEAARSEAVNVGGEIAAARVRERAAAEAIATQQHKVEEQLRRPAEAAPSELRSKDFVGHLQYVTAAMLFDHDRRLITASADLTVRLWDVAAGRQLLVLKGHTETPQQLWVSSDGLQACSWAPMDLEVRRWSLADGSLLGSFRVERGDGFQFATNAPRAISIADSLSGKVSVWDITTGTKVQSLDFRTGYSGINCVLSPDGARVVVVEGHRTRLVDVASGSVQWANDEGSDVPYRLQFAHDGTWVGYSGKFYTAASGEKIAEPAAFAMDRYSADGGWGIRDFKNAGLLTNLSIGAEVGTLGDHALAISDDGRTTVFSIDKGVRLVDVSPFMSRKIACLDTSGSSMTRVTALDRAGTLVIGGGGAPAVQEGKVIVSDYRVRVWDVARERCLCTFANHDGPIVALAVEGALAASADDSGTVRVWSVAGGAETGSFRCPERVRSLAISPDGKSVFVGDRTGAIHKVDVAGRLVRTFKNHASSVDAVAVSPDGRRLLSGSADKSALLSDTADGRVIATLKGHLGAVGTVAFSADGRQAVTGGGTTTTVRTYEAHTYRTDYSEVTKHLAGATGSSLEEAAAVVRGGGQFGAGGETQSVPAGAIEVSQHDGSVIVWDLDKALPVRAFVRDAPDTLGEWEYPVRSVRFSGDARSIVSVTGGGDVTKWDVGSGRQLFQTHDVDAYAATCGGPSLTLFTRHAGGPGRFGYVVVSATP